MMMTNIIYLRVILTIQIVPCHYPLKEKMLQKFYIKLKYDLYIYIHKFNFFNGFMDLSSYVFMYPIFLVIF